MGGGEAWGVEPRTVRVSEMRSEAYTQKWAMGGARRGAWDHPGREIPPGWLDAICVEVPYGSRSVEKPGGDSVAWGVGRTPWATSAKSSCIRPDGGVE